MGVGLAARVDVTVGLEVLCGTAVGVELPVAVEHADKKTIAREMMCLVFMTRNYKVKFSGGRLLINQTLIF